MQSFLKYGESKGCSYVELKTIGKKNTLIDTVDKEVKELTSNDSQLYAARVLYKGAFGIGYYHKPDWKKIIDFAIASAKGIKKNIEIKETQGINKVVKTPRQIDPSEISLEQKKDSILKLGDRKKYPQIVSLRKTYLEYLSDYHLVNSYNYDLKWDDSRILFYSEAFSKKGNETEKFVKRFMNHEGYEIMNKADETVNDSMDMAQQMLNAQYAIGGNFPIIVDQELGGVFTHEAVGHATEADQILQNGSVLKGKLNTQIASPKITIMDDGTKKTNGWLPYDDEGTPASATTLIKNGELVNYLQSLETAAIMDTKPTGNGRAQYLSSIVIPRMTTTFITNGNDKFDEMVRSIKKGYYLKGSKGGVVDTTKGEFLFNSTHGYYIENGEIKHIVKGPSLLGNILDILPKISMVSNDLTINNGGTCGKCGQMVPVSDGSPHMKIESATVGGQK